jgi:hypothetical protein
VPALSVYLARYEPLRRTSREHYPEAFRMTQKDIDEAPQVPTIPPLL